MTFAAVAAVGAPAAATTIAAAALVCHCCTKDLFRPIQSPCTGSQNLRQNPHVASSAHPRPVVLPSFYHARSRRLLEKDSDPLILLLKQG